MKNLIFKSLAYIFLVSAIVFLWSRFSDGAIDVTINDSQKTVYFKPAHSLEYGLFSSISSILFFVLAFLVRPKLEAVPVENGQDENLSPDQTWSKYMESSLEYGATYEKTKIREYFEELGKSFQTFKIHHFEEISEYYIKIELRGVFKDFPVKIKFSWFNDLNVSLKADIFPAFLEIYKKSGLFSAEKAKNCDPDYLETYITNHAKVYSEILKLNFNLEKIPVHKDINDPWNKDDKLRIFLANGIFVEEFEEAANVQLAVFHALSKEFQNTLIESIHTNQLKYVLLSTNEIELSIKADKLLEYPLTSVFNSLDLIVLIAKEFETVSFSGKLHFDNVGNEASEKVRLVSCRYCTSRYPLINDCSCPNCGAAYS